MQQLLQDGLTLCAHWPFAGRLPVMSSKYMSYILNEALKRRSSRLTDSVPAGETDYLLLPHKMTQNCREIMLIRVYYSSLQDYNTGDDWGSYPPSRMTGFASRTPGSFLTNFGSFEWLMLVKQYHCISFMRHLNAGTGLCCFWCLL